MDERLCWQRPQSSHLLKMKGTSLSEQMISNLVSEFEIQVSDLCHNFYGGQDRLSEACRYAMSGNGKRVRPVLALLCNQALGGQREHCWPPALALEMIHTYSLIHDDLPIFDDDDTRRGRPTLHVKFDQQTAVLAGDALLTDAWRVLCLPGQSEQPDSDISRSRLEMIHELSMASGGQGMALGQMMDLYWTGRSDYSEEDLKFVHLKKTGSLIAASCVAGALSVTRDSEVIISLRKFGEILGLAFQVTDDLLDELPGTGKSSGKDLAQDKLTYLKIMSKQKAQALAKELTTQALEILERIPGQFNLLADFSQKLLNREK